MTNMVAVGENLSVADTYDASVSSSDSASKSPEGAGQVFADMPALVKVREEIKSYKKSVSDSAEPTEGESGDIVPADSQLGVQAETASSASIPPVQARRCQSAVVARAVDKIQSTDAPSETDAGTIMAETVVGAGVEQAVTVAKASVKIEPGLAETETAVALKGPDGQNPTTQAQGKVSVQEGNITISGAVQIQSSQPSSGGTQTIISTVAQVSIAADGAEGCQKACPTEPEAVAAKTIGDGTPVQQGDRVVVPELKASDSTTKATTVEAPPANPSPINPAPTEVSAKIQIVSREQPQAETTTQISQTQVDTSADTVQVSVQRDQDSSGSSAKTVLQTAVSSTPDGKNGLPVSEEGQETQLQPPSVSQDGPAAISSRFSTLIETSGAETTESKSLTQDVGEQIGAALRAGLDRFVQSQDSTSLRVQLHPPELGTVVVRFEEQDHQIKGVLEVSRLETGREIERALPEVVRTLQDAGVQVRRFEVVVSDQAGKDSATGSSSHDGSGQPHGGSQTGNRSDGAPRGNWSHWSPGRQSANDSHQIEDSPNVVARGRIDILL
jgi:flagellar hook-length control protein FliK